MRGSEVEIAKVEIARQVNLHPTRPYTPGPGTWALGYRRGGLQVHIYRGWGGLLTRQPGFHNARTPSFNNATQGFEAQTSQVSQAKQAKPSHI